MFEQSLDNDYYANPYFPHYNDARFYDDYQHPSTTFLKPHQPPQHQINVGLPTPPSTPDKIPMNYGNFPHSGFLPPLQLPNQHQNQLPPQHQNQHQNQNVHQNQNQHINTFSPTGELQVVPEFYCDETDEASMQREGNNYSAPPPSIEDGRYSNTYMQLSPPHGLEMPPPDHLAKNDYPPALMHHQEIYFMNNQQAAQSSEENYYRQLAFEQMRNQQKLITEQTFESSEPELSRATHNVLERQRRNDLKVRFNLLRDQIPELAHNDKAPKIQILKKGLEYLRFMKKEEQMLLVDKELEKQKKLILLERLKLLRQTSR